jgi:hypothetical protein
MLDRAVIDQLQAAEEAEQALSEARERLSAQRRILRRLQTEQDWRRGTQPAAQGDSANAAGARRRSTTGLDAIYGRDNVDPVVALNSFRFLSLQREELVLDHTGVPDAQAIRFTDKDTGELRLAHSFGEARSLMENGHALGQPGDPLQRQVVWYVERSKTGKLRVDQMFVERRGDRT